MVAHCPLTRRWCYWDVEHYFIFLLIPLKQTGICLVGVFHNSGDLKGFSDTYSCRHVFKDTDVLCFTVGVDLAAESAWRFTVS